MKFTHASVCAKYSKPYFREVAFNIFMCLQSQHTKNTCIIPEPDEVDGSDGATGPAT